MDRAQANDNMVIGYDKRGQLHLILIPRNSEPDAPVIDAWTPVADE